MAAIVTGPLGETFSQVAFLIIGFALNLAGQGVAICATTILQEEVDDDYRGRIFSFYDMTFNITFVAGAGLSAVFMPVNGRSAVIIGLVAVGYAVTAAGVLDGRPAAVSRAAARPGGPPGAGGDPVLRPQPSAAVPESPARVPAGRAPSAGPAGSR